MRYLLLTLFFCSNVHAQNPDPFERIFDQMQQRMHEMMKMMDESSPLQGLFDDDFGHFGFDESSFEYHYEEGKKGRTLIIEPLSKDHELKINISEKGVRVSGTIKTEEVKKTQYGESRSSSYRSVNQTLPVPCDANVSLHKVKGEVDKKTKIFFPYKNNKSDPACSDLPDSRKVAKAKKQRGRGFKRRNYRSQKQESQTGNDEDDMIPLFPQGSGETI